MKPEGKYTFSSQEGKPGHCLMAQIWDKDGNPIATIKSTKLEEDASATAKLFAEATEIKEQHGKMLEALKKVRRHIGMIVHNWDYNEREFMPEVLKLIKEIES